VWQTNELIMNSLLLNRYTGIIPIASFRKQSGAILITSLAILVLLTIITISSSKTINLQQQLTLSTQNNALILEAAEMALIEGEDLVGGGGLTFDIAGDNGLYDGTSCDFNSSSCYLNTLADLFDESIWQDGVTSISATQGVALGPNTIVGRYKIIYLGQSVIDDPQEAAGGGFDPHRGGGLVIDNRNTHPSASQKQGSAGGGHSTALEALLAGSDTNEAAKSDLYKVIAMAEFNNVRKVLVSYVVTTLEIRRSGAQ